MTWYASNAGNDHRGLVIEESTGRNVAVTYDVADAALVAEAPAMLAELRKLVAINYVQPWGVTVPSLGPARAILARIDNP